MSSTTAAAPAKRRNTAIEFWRFFVSVIITGYHISVIFPMLIPDNVEESTWLAGGGEVLFIFTLTSGYFMMKHFMSRKRKVPGYTERSASSRAWEYLLGRIKTLMPVLCLGIIMGIISVAIYQQATPLTVLNETVNGLWEFLGTYAFGFSAAFDQSNGALWFISALFICSYLLYYLLCKNEDVTVGIIAPAVFFVLEGWWCKMGIRASQQAWSTIGSVYTASTMSVNGTADESTTTAMLGLNNGLIFVLVGMCGGMLLYFAIEELKKIDFSQTARILMGVLYAVISVVLIAYMINPSWFGDFELERMTIHLFCIVLIGMTLLQADPVSQALNCDALSGILSYLGSISLYIYMVHQPIIYLAIVVMGRDGTYSFGQLFPIVIVLSIALSVLLKFLMDKHAASKAAKAQATPVKAKEA